MKGSDGEHRKVVELEDHCGQKKTAAADLWRWIVEAVTVMPAQMVLDLLWKVTLRPWGFWWAMRGTEAFCLHRKVRHLNSSLCERSFDATRMVVRRAE